MRTLLLDPFALTVLSDPEHSIFNRIEGALVAGDHLVTTAIAWQDYLNLGLGDQDSARALCLIENRIEPFEREDAETSVLLFRECHQQVPMRECQLAASALRRDWTLVSDAYDFWNVLKPFGLRLELA